MHKRIAEAERIVDHVFADKNLIASALTHPDDAESISILQETQKQINVALAMLLEQREARELEQLFQPLFQE